MPTPLIVEPGQVANRDILLATRRGTPIENYQPDSISWNAEEQAESFERKYPNVLRWRSRLNRIYNCHGFTFASRRTCIEPTKEIHKILHEDAYNLIEDEADVEPGDVVVYFSGEGEAEHSAVVVSKMSLGFPTVVGKWGSCGEVVHAANYCPYYPATLKYYRVRNEI